MSAEVTITNGNFENEVLQSGVPVVVDFWADWCMPCKMVDPILKDLAEEYDGRLKVAKLNVDEASEIAAKFNVMSIPTLLVCNNGDIVAQQVGAVPRETIEEMLKGIV